MKTDEIVDFLSKKAVDMERNSEDSVTLSFSELSSRASALPRSAFKHRAWWANHGSKPWLKAGFRTEAVDMERQQVTFRLSRPSSRQSGAQDAHRDNANNDFRDEAGHFRFRVRPGDPDRPHPLIGVLRGKIRIAPDFDLTTPADPDWGKAYDD
jgi:hypothetical protein